MKNNLDGNGTKGLYKNPSRFMKQVFCVSLVVYFLILIKPLHAKERHVLEKEWVTVLYEEPLRIGAEEVANIYPKIKGNLEKILPWKVDFGVTILLIKKSEAFQRMAGSELVVAFAVPDENLMVIDYSKVSTDPFTIEATMKHELCHLLLHHQVDDGKLPKWLDEGLAQWVSQGIAELIVTQRRSILNETVLKGQYIRIRTLTNRFPGERKSLQLAYEASNSFVEYIVRKHGIDRIEKVIQHLNAGDTQESAFLASLSVSLDDLEKGWHDALRKRITWFNYVINHLYEILFFIAALIMVYGFIRVFMKKRAYNDDDEDDDYGY
jgi:hypothetical protein